MEKKTPLYEQHIQAGGKMVPFAGYSMPVQYQQGVIAEHKAVREAAGVFDVSHMGEFRLSGEGALATLQMLLTNDMAGMQPGSCRYSPMCNEKGGTIDDLIVYCFGPQEYWLVVNAANRAEDAAHIRANLAAGAHFSDESEATAELAVQGPLAAQLLGGLCSAAALPEKGYTFVPELQVAGVKALVSRTGYTGEDGFELYCAAGDAARLWQAVVEAGAQPCGLGARDTLRLEAGMPLYGHELSESISPLEGGLGFFVKLDKPAFIGRAALEAMGKPARRRAGLRVTGRGIAREGSVVYLEGREIGRVTSGTMLPHVGYAGAMALLEGAPYPPGTQLEVDVRGRRLAAETVKLPFYKRGE